MDYSKRIVQLFGERCTKESHHHDRGSEPEWCDRCFAYAQHDEIERLREALQRIVEVTNYGTKTSTTMSEFAVNNANILARSALQQKESE